MITIRLPEDRSPLTFESLDVVCSWLQEISTNWNWLSQVHGMPFRTSSEQIHSTLNSKLTHIRNSIERVNRSSDTRNDANGIITSIQADISAMLAQWPWLLDTHPKYQFIAAIRGAGRPRIAGLIIAIWMSIDLREVPTVEAVEAVLEWQFYSRGIEHRADAQLGSIEKLSIRFDKLLADSTAAASNAVTSLTEIDTTARSEEIVRKSNFDEEVETRSGEWRDLLAAGQDKLRAIEIAYDAHMAIQSPVRYWENKRRRHSFWAIGTAALAASSMGGVAWMLIYQINNTSEKLKQAAMPKALAAGKTAGEEAKAMVDMATKVDLPSTWHFDVAVLVLLGTLGFWLIRLVVRVFLSHLHLENDAAERVTMARTYLALLRRGKLPEGDDLKTILAALFRPSGDGIVKDDGIPPSMVDLLTKLK